MQDQSKATEALPQVTNNGDQVEGEPETLPQITNTRNEWEGGPVNLPQVTNHGDQVAKHLVTDQWTAGFFPATLYEMARRNDLCPNTASFGAEVDWLQLGREWSSIVLPLADGNSQGGDQGFLSLPFVAELAINPTNETAITTVNKFAALMAARYDPSVGCTRSWNSTNSADFQVTIDNMANLDLLYTTANLTGNSTLKAIATSHANTTIQNHFRASNHSTWQVVHYNATTGAVIDKTTYQGYANWSTWSRGQSWAMLGYGSMYLRTGAEQYLETARLASQSFLSNVPTNTFVPADFDAPGFPATADTSAGAIAATALIQLATIERSLQNNTGSDYYIVAAVNLLNGISELGWQPTWNSLLSNGTDNYPAGNYQTGLVYGDYYYVKAGNDLIANGFITCASATR
ncbi:d-4,5 unsaturated-glucuronyl hydrolase-like protein [Clavulina sp. PMI_390]|nr:d-4,5 unsaturated-glucuronyl hydrolase-like protein [Clavulina sp. PMI_390]